MLDQAMHHNVHNINFTFMPFPLSPSASFARFLSALWVAIIPLTFLGQSHYTRQYISVAGKKMSYESFGLKTCIPGNPVLVFEGGNLTSGAINFKGLFPALSKFTAGIGYDRNGEGESEEDSTLLTDKDLIRRLHAFLEAVHVAPPYILVGHSLGGPYIRLFTSLYPSEVAGLVFIDPADFMLTEQQDEEFKRVTHSNYEFMLQDIQKTADDTSVSTRIRHHEKRLLHTIFQNGYFHEYTSLAPLPDIPIAVLLAYNRPIPASPDTSAQLRQTKARVNAMNHFRIENYTAMIQNNHNSCVILLPGYGHFIHAQDPSLVVTVIERVYHKALATLKGLK
jgi:pimeloyl-ACP methyl ester carboxylesterase